MLHFSFAFCQCSTGVYQVFDGQTEFSWVFNFDFIVLRKLKKIYVCENNMVYSINATYRHHICRVLFLAHVVFDPHICFKQPEQYKKYIRSYVL